MIPDYIIKRIKEYAPEHKQRLSKVLDAVLYSFGNPNRCNAINLSPVVEIEDEPFPYVVGPTDEEATLWADGIRAKPILHSADINFHCCCDEQHGDIVYAIVRHPTLQALKFGRGAHFSKNAFVKLFKPVRGLKKLVVQQRAIASPICENPHVMDRVFSGMMFRSRDTLETLRLTLIRCNLVCTALPQMHRLKNLQLDRFQRFQFDTIPDLRGLHELHTVSIRDTTRMHEFVQMLPASLKSLHLECNVASGMYDAMSAFITTHGQLESFRLYIHHFDEDMFVEKMYPVLMRAKHIQTFKLYGPHRMRSLEVPGFEKECHISSRYEVMIKFFRPDFH